MNQTTWLIPVAILCALCAGPARAQDVAPCASEEARQLDFWLGEWDLSWEGGSGSNLITRRFDDCVIEENFSGQVPSGLFLGHSVSVWDGRRGEWRQTWVDNQGSYLVFTGGIGEDEVMRLHGETRELPDGRTQVTRMSWIDVEDDSLDWHWERSVDGGVTWEMVWAIHYERR